MRLLYVDESGDTGVHGSRHYILTGVVVPVTQWRTSLDSIKNIRGTIKSNHGLPIRTELHGAELIYPRGTSKYGCLNGRYQRIEVYKYFLREIATRMQDIRVINIHVDKQKTVVQDQPAPDFETLAWTALLQRFHNHLEKDCGNDNGMIFADETNEVKLRKLIRQLRVFNYVPSQYAGGVSRPLPLSRIIEDPVMRDSSHSWFIQVADMISHSLYRKLYTKGSLRRFNVDRVFDLVDPILLKKAARNDPQGIVHL